jgi:hypothetical protein
MIKNIFLPIVLSLSFVVIDMQAWLYTFHNKTGDVLFIRLNKNACSSQETGNMANGESEELETGGCCMNSVTFRQGSRDYEVTVWAGETKGKVSLPGAAGMWCYHYEGTVFLENGEFKLVEGKH